MAMDITELAAATNVGAQPEPKLNIFIADCSGSMGWTISWLAEDTITRVEQVPIGDGLMVGVFSSPGMFYWIAMAVLHGPEDYAGVETEIRNRFYARATTCFSEILESVPSMLKVTFDLDHFKIITLTFMSDGCPVVPDLRKEDAAMEAAALALQPLISSGAVIAYGDYADRARLSKLATTIGLELVMADTVAQVGESLEKTTKRAPRKRRRIEVPKDTECIFSVGSDGTVTPLDAKAKEVSASEDASVYVLDKIGRGILLDREDIRYAGALALVQDNRVDDALDMLATLGDVGLVQQVSQSLTNAELAMVEQQLKLAVVSPTARYTKGKQVGCLPKDDAFDVLDLLELLMNDEECKFYPRHPAFQYKRIGRATKPKEGHTVPVFIPESNVCVPLSRLVGHSSELNLSIGVRIPGTIELPPGTIHCLGEDGKPLLRRYIGLPQVYETHIFRTYSLIANAMLSVTQLPITLSMETLKVLVSEGITDGSADLQAGVPHFGKDLISVLDLTRVPLCNRQRGRDAANWTRMADLAMESLRLGSKVKVWRAKRDELDPERDTERKVSLTGEQSKFLEACGVRRDGSFSPPVEVEEATDVLDVRRLEVKVDKGSPVSMKDFTLMLDGKKKINFVGTLMEVGHEEAHKAMLRHPLKANYLLWLQDQIRTVEGQKRKVDAQLNAQRFAVALTGAWRKYHSEDSVTVPTAGGWPVHMTFDSFQKRI